MYKRESGSNNRKSGKPEGKKPFIKTTAAKRKSSDSSDFGDRKPRGGKDFDKPSGKGAGERRTYGKSPRGEEKPFDRAPRKTRSYGEDRPVGRGSSDRKPTSASRNSRDRDDSKSFDRTPRKTRSYGEDRPTGRSFSDRKPTVVSRNSRDRDDSRSSDRPAGKTRTYGANKSSERSFDSKRSASGKPGFREKNDSRSFDKKETSKNPRSTNPYNRTPRKPTEDKPSRFSDRKVSREESEDSRKPYNRPTSGKDDKLKSRSGRGPRKADILAEKKKAQKDETPQKGNIRLNRFIANAGVCSRREADDLILAGLVTVNGVAIEEMGYQVKPNDDVRYNGERLSREKKVYIILNKPKDAITTSDDPEGRRTVMQLFGNELGERIYPVGRLDRNTTGVLLFTNDGDLAQRLMHPKYEMKKVYKATLNKTFKGEDMWQLSNGVELEDGFIKPDAVAYPDAKNKAEVGIEIHSGKNHIIHRIFESLGYKVDKLDRALYGGLTKGKLKRGEWRELTEKEVNTLKRTLKLS